MFTVNNVLTLAITSFNLTVEKDIRPKINHIKLIFKRKSSIKDKSPDIQLKLKEY